MGERTTTRTPAALARDSHVGLPHAPSGGELTMPRRLRPMTAADLALLPYRVRGARSGRSAWATWPLRTCIGIGRS